MANGDSGRSADRHRRSLIGPLILIVVGALFLLSNLGFLPWGFWGTLWQFWPVILVLIGIELLFGRFHPWLGAIVAVVIVAVVIALSVAMAGGLVQPLVVQQGEVERVVEEMGTLTSGTVELEFGAGDISVAALPVDSANLVEADITPGTTGSRLDRRFSQSNGEGNLRLRTEDGFRVPTGRIIGDSWDVKLNSRLPLDLRVKTGASQTLLNLTELNLSELRIDVGASSAEIKMPAAGSTKAAIKAGAASVNVAIPQTMAAKIRAKGGLSSIDIDQSRFPKQGSYYISSNWDSSTDRVELEIDSGVASVSVR